MASISATAAASTLFSVAGTVSIGAKTVHATAATSTLFGVSAVVTASEFPQMAVYGADNSWIANLPLARGIKYQTSVNDVGSISCQLPMDDAATAEVSTGRILKVFWRGGARQASKVNDSSLTFEDGTGRQWRQFDALPGCKNMLSEARVYPENWPALSAATTRTVGYMSNGGPWFHSSDWSHAQGIKWSDMTGVRAGKPAGLDFPNPSWISLHDPHFYEPVGQIQYFRHRFTVPTDNTTYQILATADNDITLWLDGEQLIAPDAQQGQTWMFLVQVTGIVNAGTHLLAGKVHNSGYHPSPVGLLLTMQQTAPTGDVVPGAPLVNSNTSWLVTDAAVGWRKADALVKLLQEAHGRMVAALAAVTLGFDGVHDTAGVPWADAPSEYPFDINTDLLSVDQQLTEADIDTRINPDTLAYEAFNRMGTDRFSTVQLSLGGGIVSHQVTRVEPKFNTALIQLANGTWIERQDATAAGTYGRSETGLSLGSTGDKAAAQATADAQFAESAYPHLTFNTELSSLAGPQVHVDWDTGDSIGVPNETGDDYVKVRVMEVTVDASQDGAPKVTPTLVVDGS